jgi:hypothetical protein
MNPTQLLDRIFSLSRHTPDTSRPVMPYGLETVVLVHWREALAHRSMNLGLLRGLRWAALTACIVAFLVGILKSDEFAAAFTNRYDPETRLADSAIVAGYDYE